MTPLRRLIVWPMILSLGAAAAAADWPQFRGPGAMGIAAKEKGVPTKWDDDTNVAWKVELPGPGGAAPSGWAGNGLADSPVEPPLAGK